MVKKGPNQKAVAALEKKAAHENQKKQQEQQLKEHQASKDWEKGSKDSSKNLLAEEKRKEALAKKAEREALLAAEEQELSAKKPTMKGVDKKALEKTFKIEQYQKEKQLDITEYSASGLDAALEMMDLAATSSDKAVKKGIDEMDRHPERRMKGAYTAFEERELPKLKSENPGLRLSQLKQMLQKQWKKSPENPMNQSHISFDTKVSDLKNVVQEKQAAVLEEYKTTK